MRVIIAAFLPWLAFFTMGMVGKGIIAFVLQCTLIGWPIAAIWASVSVRNFYDDQRANRIVEAIQSQKAA